MTSKKKRLLLVGAGSLARELAGWLDLRSGAFADFSFGGFLSDDPDSLSAYPQYQPAVIGSIADYQPKAEDRLVMAIADPRAKLKVADLLLERGSCFTGMVHPSVIISDWVSIGMGVVVCPNAVISCHAKIDDFATINIGCTVGHDVSLGRGCTLSAHVDLTGFAEIGEGAFFGTHAAVLPKSRVGNYATVGAGSMVLRSVKPGATVMGVPARQISP